jgi:hypothetical protein
MQKLPLVVFFSSLLSVTSTYAETAWKTYTTCSVLAPAAEGQDSMLILTGRSSESDGAVKSYTRVQINLADESVADSSGTATLSTDTGLTWPNIKASISKFEQRPVIFIPVTPEMKDFMAALRTGSELSVDYVSPDLQRKFVISLAGSGVALKQLTRCM